MALRSLSDVSADRAEDPQSTASIVEGVVPAIAAETADSDHVRVSDEGDSVSISVAPVADELDTVADAISFNVDYAEAASALPDGTVVLSTQDVLTSALVQPTNFGVRVLTTIAGPQAPENYVYTFDVPEGTVLTKSKSRYYLDSDSSPLGSLRLPWAVDSKGQRLPTTYSWAGTTLTQHVDLSDSGISYPVIADPAWGYTYNYKVTKTAGANKALLKKCFNCYFPVTGAPRAFPKVGQLLPLKVAGFNFECKFKREVTATNYFAFQFDATKNHIDGLGSNIVFEFRTVGNVKYLTVSAYIANDVWWVRSEAYRIGAGVNWMNFANNLNSAPSGAGGGGGGGGV